MRLKLGRCRVRVSFWFFALLAAAAVYGGEMTLGGIIAAAVHESGHIIAACVCAGNAVPVSFDITPVGLRMNVIPEGIGIRRELFILSAGIAANLLASALLLCAGRILPGGVAVRHAAVGICAAAVNAAPIIPLDGGRILNSLLERRLGYDKAARASFIVSLIALFFMAVTGFYILLGSAGNFSLLALSLWLLWKLASYGW